MAKKKQILYPVFFMVLITVIFTSGLAIINELTIDRIQSLEDLKVKKSILYAADLIVSDDEVEAFYSQHITVIQSVTDFEVYASQEDGQIDAYIYRFDGPGLWGTITGYIAVSPELDKLIGIDFLSNNETPGLGGRITEEWFKEQFRDISLENRDDNFISYAPAENSNVDAITGATKTSESVRKIFNTTLNGFIETAKGGF
jgi:Na+-transporting NADH:ubiquinone oxidoreductase subunit C